MLSRRLAGIPSGNASTGAHAVSEPADAPTCCKCGRWRQELQALQGWTPCCKPDQFASCCCPAALPRSATLCKATRAAGTAMPRVRAGRGSGRPTRGWDTTRAAPRKGGRQPLCASASPAGRVCKQCALGFVDVGSGSLGRTCKPCGGGAHCLACGQDLKCTACDASYGLDKTASCAKCRDQLCFKCDGDVRTCSQCEWCRWLGGLPASSRPRAGKGGGGPWGMGSPRMPRCRAHSSAGQCIRACTHTCRRCGGGKAHHALTCREGLPPCSAALTPVAPLPLPPAAGLQGWQYGGVWRANLPGGSQCLPCTVGCLRCIDQRSCEQCAPGMANVAAGFCFRCGDPRCSECHRNPNQCTACRAKGYVARNGRCVRT